MLEQFQRSRESEQKAADEVAGNTFSRASELLMVEGVSSRRVRAAIIRALGRGLESDPQTLSYDELWDIRTAEKTLEFEGEGEKKVSIVGYAWDKKKAQPYRSFVYIGGFPKFIELRKDHGVMWDKATDGKRTYSRRGGRATLEEALLFQTVVDRFRPR